MNVGEHLVKVQRDKMLKDIRSSIKKIIQGYVDIERLRRELKETEEKNEMQNR